MWGIGSQAYHSSSLCSTNNSHMNLSGLTMTSTIFNLDIRQWLWWWTAPNTKGDGKFVMGIESTHRNAMDRWLVTAVNSFGPFSGSSQIDTIAFSIKQNAVTVNSVGNRYCFLISLSTTCDCDGRWRWTACDGNRKHPTYCNGWLACDNGGQLWPFLKKLSLSNKMQWIWTLWVTVVAFWCGESDHKGTTTPHFVQQITVTWISLGSLWPQQSSILILDNGCDDGQLLTPRVMESLWWG